MNVFEIIREIKFDFVNIVHRLTTCEITQMQFVSHKSFSAAHRRLIRSLKRRIGCAN